jgi:DnaJ-class molecular chaperone
MQQYKTWRHAFDCPTCGQFEVIKRNHPNILPVCPRCKVAGFTQHIEEVEEHKTTCPMCNGSGVMIDPFLKLQFNPKDYLKFAVECTTCKGGGRVEKARK